MRKESTKQFEDICKINGLKQFRTKRERTIPSFIARRYGYADRLAFFANDDKSIIFIDLYKEPSIKAMSKLLASFRTATKSITVSLYLNGKEWFTETLDPFLKGVA